MTALEVYRDAKQHNPEALALIRMGDFYEAFHADARTVAKVIGLTLTTRTFRSTGETQDMTGFPYHMLDSTLQKLVAAGYRVSVCEW